MAELCFGINHVYRTGDGECVFHIDVEELVSLEDGGCVTSRPLEADIDEGAILVM